MTPKLLIKFNYRPLGATMLWCRIYSYTVFFFYTMVHVLTGATFGVVAYYIQPLTLVDEIGFWTWLFWQAVIVALVIMLASEVKRGSFWLAQDWFFLC